jgi:hypothetical protein
VSSSTDDLRAKLESGLAAGDVASVLALFDKIAAQQSVLEQQQRMLEQQQVVLEQKLERRELLIRRLQRIIYGRSSEKLSHDDLRQLVLLYVSPLPTASPGRVDAARLLRRGVPRVDERPTLRHQLRESPRRPSADDLVDDVDQVVVRRDPERAA